MELPFVVLGGGILGAFVRYTLPGRHTYGAVILPALGAVVAAVVWVILTWAGLAWDGGWIWWITFLVSAALSALAALWLPRGRQRSDEHRLAELLKA